MKKIYFAAIAVISLIPFVSKAQWSLGGSGSYYLTSGYASIGTTNFLHPLTVSNGTSSTFNQTQIGLYNPFTLNPDVRNWLIATDEYAYGSFAIKTSSSQGVNPAGSGLVRFLIDKSGNVGIGTTSPGAKLHLQADANTSGAPDNAQFYITGNSAPGKRLSFAYNTSSNYGEIQSQAYSGGYTNLNLNPNGGNVGIGTTNPPTVGNYGVLAINGRSPSQGGYLSLMNNGAEVGSLAANSQLNIGAATGIVTQFYTGSTPTMQITAGGNMLLGKTSQANASYLLDVNGKARCNEVVVNTTGADFVFQPGYKLNTLADIEKYVQANHHLPEIPSAQEMVADGLKVGEMNKLLLMKVEELTLYLIDKDKEVKGQQEEINQLKQLQTANHRQQKQIDDLKEQIEHLSKKVRKN